MKFAKRLLMVGGAVALAGIIGTMMVPKVAHAVVSTLVTVVNTPNVNIANTPVPVSGNVNATINGTPSVNVSGMPAVNVASVSGNVPVANPLDGSGNPIPLVTQEDAARSAFDVEGSCSFSAGNTCVVSPLFNVPANDVAVIQNFSGRCAIESGTSVAEVIMALTGSLGVSEAVAVPGPGIPFGTQLRTTFAGETPDYAFGGSSGTSIGVVVASSTNETGGADVCYIKLAGYLVAQ